MAKPNAPDRDPEAVLRDIERALQGAGFETVIRRSPDDPFTGVVATVEQGTGRRRQVIAVREDSIGNFRLYLSRAYEVEGSPAAEDLEKARHITSVNGIVGVGEDLARRARSAILLGKPDDPQATLADLREAITFIADPGRNTSSTSNPRGDDLISLANVLLRIIERFERIESQTGPSATP